MLRKKLKLLLTVPAVALILSSAVCAGENRTYSGQFTDVPENAWYYSGVAGAYSLGLVSGLDDTHFSPDGSVTVAQTIKLAVCCYQLLSDGCVNEDVIPSGRSWYDGYVSYATQAGIVTEEYDDYSAAATRAQTAVLLSRAVIASGVEPEELNPIEFGALPDVPTDAWYAGHVYRLYRWGIMTGGSDGKINPDSTVKRSEIAAVVMRIAEPEERVCLTEKSSAPAQVQDSASNEEPGSEAQPSTSSATSVVLYEGERKEQSFTGITSFGAQFNLYNGIWVTNASYSLELVNNIVLEDDNISFRLYKSCGFEALGIVRGWLNEAACGRDGERINNAAVVYSAINNLLYVYIDGTRAYTDELWYADHGDYVTYAFYFTESVDVDNAGEVKLLCGRENSDTLTLCGLSELATLVDSAEKELEYPGDTVGSISVTQSYDMAVSDAKDGAEILFEEENSRCLVLYGCGLYGRSHSEYRLIFIYPDGTTQTVATQKLLGIRMSENVLYYTLTAPDGEKLQYGVNFN